MVVRAQATFALNSATKICMVSCDIAMQTDTMLAATRITHRKQPAAPGRSRPAGVAGILLLALAAGVALPGHSDARRELLTDEAKARLKAIERIHLETLALTDHGATDETGIASVAAARLKTVGYTVVSDQAQPHDVTVKVKCEERKVWEGTVRSGGDADLSDAASRLWRGPACQITYRVDGHGSEWRHEVRGDAPEAAAPTAAANGSKALARLADRLAADPFPLLLAREWGQTARLLQALENPAAPPAQKLIVIDLLGDMFAVESIPALSRTLKDRDQALVQRAANALGAIGHRDGIPVLLELLAHQETGHRLAAINGLGRLAPLHPDSGIVPALLERLPREPVPVQTEIVRALGKTTDRRILVPLRALNRTVQDRARSDSSPELKELKRSLGQALDQFDGTHSDE